MRIFILLSTTLLLAFFSCDNTRYQEKPKNQTPKALENKSSDYEIVSKRGNHDDLVESLYKELSDKTPALNELETQIDKLSESKSDSLELFNRYNGKNESYYHYADSHTEQIKDPIIKEQMKMLIQSSLAKYSSLIDKHNDILNSIEKKTITLDDLHQVLKITRTLPLIETYQMDNLPTTKPLEGYSKQLNKSTEYAERLTKN